MAQFPKTHAAIAATLLFAFIVIAATKMDRDDTAPQRVTTALPILSIATPSETEQPQKPTIQLTARTERVAQGDNLAIIFKRVGFPARELQRILDSGTLGKRLDNIFPGHELTFTTDPNGVLVGFVYSPGPLETLEFARSGDIFVATQVIEEPERVTTHRHAVIDHSLFIASQRIGLDDEITLRLARIFQWDIDFVLDIRRGDEFFLLFEELYLHEELIGYGEILAAEFVNGNDRYQAVRYVTGNGQVGYYNPAGQNMRKTFLRAPVAFNRVSSNFNLKRVHPMFKRSMPHRGIDYAAPSGTPVLAAGSGKVVKATRNRANGNYVVLQHGEQFQTRYLHLSKFGRKVRRGRKVEQGQIIGYVGATGFATGAHLHYEFLVNGIHKNPRTVKLPAAKPIARAERKRFESQTEPLLALLETYKQEQQFAAAF